MNDAIAHISFIEEDFAVMDFANKNWQAAENLEVFRYYSGDVAPIGRQMKVRLLWSDAAFYARFEANQSEPPIVSENANLESKTIGLWERDVCEIFVAPNVNQPRKYFEFEAAPNGEWLDVAIDFSGAERIADWNYRSDMQTAGAIFQDNITVTIKIPWRAFGQKPSKGERWLGNLLRCVGEGEHRGYLTWQPTNTSFPDFHIPEKFGTFEFV